jgi:hypothetical protein
MAASVSPDVPESDCDPPEPLELLQAASDDTSRSRRRMRLILPSRWYAGGMVGGPLERLRALRAAVAAAGSGGAPDAALSGYLEKVRVRATDVTDAEVAALLAAGQSQDAVFEATVVVALDAALERLEAGLRALDAAERGT